MPEIDPWLRVLLSAAVVILFGALWVRDVRARQRIERDRARLLRLFSEEPACLKTVSRDLKLLDMNPAGIEMIEADHLEQVRHADLTSVVHPDDVETFRKVNERVFAGEIVVERFRIIGLRGTHRWVETHAAPLRDAAGEVVAQVAVTNDVTRQVGLDRQILDTNARLEAVIDNVASGIVLFDGDGQIVRANPACRALFGFENEGILGRSIHSLLVESSEIRSLVGSVVGREFSGRRTDGSTFPMLLSIGEVDQHDEPVFVGVIQDLSAQQRSQQHLMESQKMEAVGQLSGGIAHDFNNLLTIVVGSAGVLMDLLPENSEGWDLAEMIFLAGARGAEQTQRLLAFGRRQLLQPVVLQCDVLIRNLDSLLRSAIDDDIDIVLNLEDGLLPVSADPNQLESSLLNLALNARDAMPDGGRLVISATNLPLGAQAILGSPDGSETLVAERYVMLEVSDDGTGMPSEVLSRAFEPFFTTKDVGEGTGLGLSMVYGFARQSNGYVTLVSEPGLGTSARLYLPSLPEPVKATAAEPVQEESAASKVAAGRSLMVVEDDTLVRAYMVNCLSSLGYRVLSCSNGREALAVLSSGQPLDLVVTDTVMPGGVSGIEVVDRAKILRPDLPVLLTSGYAVESLAAKGRYRPSTPFLPKPFSRDELANAVAKLIVDAGRKQGVENVERMS